MTQPTRKIFARYFSPGILFAENSERFLETGTVKEAVQLAKQVKERHGATPFAFDLVTKLTAPPIDDGEGGTLEVQPKIVERKGRFYLGGTLWNYERVVAGEGERSTWASNMRGNRHPLTIQCCGTYRSVQFFEEGDVIVDPASGQILRRGDEPELKDYRAQKLKEWER